MILLNKEPAKMEEDLLGNVNEEFAKLIKKQDLFLRVQDKTAEKSQNLLKRLYDSVKAEESSEWRTKEALPELIVADFDEEQIWQELQLQNEGINDRIVKDIAVLLSKKDRLAFQLSGDDGDVSEEDGESLLGEEEEEPLEGEEDSDDDEENSDEDELFDDKEKDEPGKHNFTSELDDEFFKMSEMENFCDKVEAEEGGGGGGFDLFGGAESDEERELVRYKDFFVASKKVVKGKKGVKFAEEEDDEEEDDEGDIGSEEDADGKEEGDDIEDEPEKDSASDGPKSTFQARQDRLKARIESLEEEAMKEKPWFLKGEITSHGRPQNSLLQEYVEFDRAARPAPVFTEKTTLRLEDIIKQRVKDKSWDDVERKLKPVESAQEFRKRLVLDQEKSKVSLAEIYEQEYIKQRDAAATAASGEIPEDKPEPEAHQAMRVMMAKLFAKLDALSNFHYTPKMVTPDIKIISNLPAIAMEDVAPVSTSDAALLAPEEVKNKRKGELMSKAERTDTDKKRERRKKKQLQRVKQKDKQKKEKAISKMGLGLGNKYSKENAKRELEKLTKSRNVEKINETQAKVRSSTAFFSKLEDQAKLQTNEAVKRKKFKEGLSAKRIKL